MNLRWHKYRLLFSVNGRVILFNLLNKAAISLNEEFCRHVEMSGEFKPLDDENINEVLRSRNFIIPSELSDYELLDSWFNALCHETRVFEFLLLLTNQCNFSCQYCFQEADAKFREHVDRWSESNTQWIISAILERKPRYVRSSFFGGEPLMDVSLLESVANKLMDTCNRVSAKWRCDLVTNGYSLDKTVVSRLANIGLKRIQITLDGPEEVHNRRRRLVEGTSSTFKKILNGIHSVVDAGCFELHVRTNLDKDNFDHFSKLLDILEAEGLKNKIALSVVPTREASIEWYWNSMCYKGKQEIKCLEKSYLEATSRGFKIFCRSLEAGPCIAIARGGLVIEPNGNISKCHHLAGNPKYILGNINKGVSLQVLDEVLPSAWKGCVQCECVPLCLGGCRYEAVRYVNRVDAKICGVKSYFKEIIPAYLSQVIKSEAPDERKQDSIFIR